MGRIDDEEFRALLDERRASLLDAAGDRAASFEEVAGARSAATADDEHDPEGATLSEEWSRLAGLEAQARRDLADVDDALRRIDEGSYGICEICGGPIPVDRLRARPTARRCVTCASR